MSFLQRSFFERNVLSVAEDLLGKYLCTPEHACMITEVEAYDGPQDLACHGRFGKTKRTEVMFGPAGHWYVYLCYGVHWMLNIVTGEEGYPAAVLVRSVLGDLESDVKGVRGVRGIDVEGGVSLSKVLNGPGRVTAAFGIDRTLSGMPAVPSLGLWMEDRGFVVPCSCILRVPRIGVDYAGAWAKKPYRFVLQNKS